jgi:hypothetical protein
VIVLFKRVSSRPVPSFGLLKPFLILVAHLLLNTKKNKGPIFNFFNVKSRIYSVFSINYIKKKKKMK